MTTETDGDANHSDRRYSSRLRCFVIGPIGSQLAPPGSEERQHYEDALQVLAEVITPACQAVGLDPVRADGIARAGEITEQIFRRLRADDVVIADLTGANPNVMYELGLRHSRDLFTVQIGEYGRLPFDVTTIRTVQFSRSPYGLIQARNELQQILEAGLAGQYDPAAATRVWTEDERSAGVLDDSPPAFDAELSADTDDAPGFIDILAAGEAAAERITEASNGLTTLLDELTAVTNYATEQTRLSDARGAGIAGRLRVAAEHAHNLDALAPRFESAAATYVDVMKTVAAGWAAIIGRVETNPDQLADALDFFTTLRNAAQIARQNVESNRELTASLLENAKAARVLRPPTRRIVAQLNWYADETGFIDEIDRRLQALGVPLPAPESNYHGPDADDEITA